MSTSLDPTSRISRSAATNETSPADDEGSAYGLIAAKFLSFLKPTVALLILLGIWQETVGLKLFPQFTIATPSQTLQYVWHHPATMLSDAWSTLQVGLIGFGLALVGGILLGILISQFKLLRDALMPLLIITQVIPSIAIAPILVLVLGFGEAPRIATSTIIAFFPVLVNTLTGLDRREENMVALSRSMGATRLQTLRYFSLPNALPVIFAGARVSATMSVIGAVVGEFVVADKGLGYEILQGASSLRPDIVFAALLGLAIIGIAFFALVRVTEYIALPWARTRKD